MYEYSSSSPSSPTLGVASLNLHSSDEEWCLTFLYAQSLLGYPLHSTPQVFTCIHWIIFFQLILPLLDKYIANIPSHFVACLFLMVVCWTEVLNFNVTPFIIFFSFVVGVFCILLRNLCLSPRSGKYSPIFSSGSCIGLVSMSRAIIILHLISMWIWARGQDSFFHMDMQLIQHHLLERLFFPHCTGVSTLS